MKCSKCGEDKSLSDFYIRKNGSPQDCCKKCFILRGSAYQRREKDAVNARANARYKRNPEKYKKQSREWYLQHPDVRTAVNRKYHVSHPKPSELNRIYCGNRYAKRKNADGKYTKKEWDDLLIKYGNKCLCCGRSDIKLTVDHIVPLKLGGSNFIDNIQPLCSSCNSRKNAKHIDYRRT